MPEDHRPAQRGPGRPRDDDLAARRREEILACATRHFARSGFANTDLDAVAAELGCAKGTLYRYFPAKRELFAACVDRVMEGLIAATEAAHAEDPIDRIEAAIHAFLAYFGRHPDYVELLIQERAEFRDRDTPTGKVHEQAHRRRWKRVYLQLMREGRFRKVPVDRLLDTMREVLYGTIFTDHFAGRRPLEQRAAALTDLVLGGLLTPEEAARRAPSRGPRRSR